MSAPRVPDRRTLAVVATGLLTAVVLAVVQRLMVATSGSWLADLWLADLRVYLLGGETVLAGGQLYDVRAAAVSGTDFAAPFTYPPFAAVLFAPLTWVPAAALGPLWDVAKLVCLQIVVWLTLGAAGVPPGRRRWIATLAAVALALLLDPVGQDLLVGQVNIFLMLLVLADLLRLQGARWRGAGVGLAAGIKLTPAIFVLYLLATRRFREAGTAIAVFLSTVAVGVLAAPASSWRYWTVSLWQADRVAEAQITLNQSLRGVLVRLLQTTDVALPWLAAALVVTVAGVALAAARSQRNPLEGVLACAITGILVSPHSWIHHWVWIVPVLAVLVVRAAGGGGPAWWGATAVVVVVFTARPYLFAVADPRDALGLGAVAQLLAASFVLVGVLLLVLTAPQIRGRTWP